MASRDELLGLTPTNMPLDYWRSVREFHRPFAQAIQRDYGMDVEGFRQMRLESMLALVAQGYGMTDIAAFWGITRQRVLQCFAREGIDRSAFPNGSLPRVWDSGMGAFRALSRAEYRALMRRSHRQKGVDRRKRRNQATRRMIVMRVRTLAGALGRPPRLVEVTTALETDVPALARLFSGITFRAWQALGPARSKQGYYARALGRLYRLCGMAPRREQLRSARAIRRREQVERLAQQRAALGRDLTLREVVQCLGRSDRTLRADWTEGPQRHVRATQPKPVRNNAYRRLLRLAGFENPDAFRVDD